MLCRTLSASLVVLLVAVPAAAQSLDELLDQLGSDPNVTDIIDSVVANPGDTTEPATPDAPEGEDQPDDFVGQTPPPTPQEIPPLGERADVDTPGERSVRALSAVREQFGQRRARQITAGTVRPGVGIANFNTEVADLAPERNTPEAVLAGTQSLADFLAVQFVDAAADRTITLLTAALAFSNPFEQLFSRGNNADDPPPLTFKKPGNTKLAATADQVLEAQSLTDFSDELTGEALQFFLQVQDDAAP